MTRARFIGMVENRVVPTAISAVHEWATKIVIQSTTQAVTGEAGQTWALEP